MDNYLKAITEIKELWVKVLDIYKTINEILITVNSNSARIRKLEDK